MIPGCLYPNGLQNLTSASKAINTSQIHATFSSFLHRQTVIVFSRHVTHLSRQTANSHAFSLRVWDVNQQNHCHAFWAWEPTNQMGIKQLYLSLDFKLNSKILQFNHWQHKNCQLKQISQSRLLKLQYKNYLANQMMSEAFFRKRLVQ